MLPMQMKSILKGISDMIADRRACSAGVGLAQMVLRSALDGPRHCLLISALP